MINRIDEMRKHYGLSLNALDRKLDLGNGYFGRQLKNDANLGSQVIEKIYAIFPVSAEWLLGDDVPMERVERVTEYNMVAENQEEYHTLTDFDKMVLKSLHKKDVKAFLENLIKEEMSQK